MRDLTAAIALSAKTKRAIAKHAGIHETKLTGIERGVHSTNYQSALRLAEVLETTLDALVGADWPTAPMPVGDAHPLLLLAGNDRDGFAAAAGVSAGFLGQVVAGKSGMTVRTLEACARAGRVPLHSLAVAMREVEANSNEASAKATARGASDPTLLAARILRIRAAIRAGLEVEPDPRAALHRIAAEMDGLEEELMAHGHKQRKP